MDHDSDLHLGDDLDAFVATQVRLGAYSSPADVVRAAVRLFAEREAALADLRRALEEGESSGPPAPFDFDAFLMSKRS